MLGYLWVYRNFFLIMSWTLNIGPRYCFWCHEKRFVLGEKNLQLRYDWLIRCPLRLHSLDDLIETNQYSLFKVFLQRKSEYCWKMQKDSQTVEYSVCTQVKQVLCKFSDFNIFCVPIFKVKWRIVSLEGIANSLERLWITGEFIIQLSQ